MLAWTPSSDDVGVVGYALYEGLDAHRDDGGTHRHTGRAFLRLDVRAPGRRCGRGGQSLPVRKRLRADMACDDRQRADDPRRPRSHVEDSGERLAGLVAVDRRRRSGRLPRDVERGARSRGHGSEHDRLRTHVRDRVRGRGSSLRRRRERVAGGQARRLHDCLPRASPPPPPPADTTPPSAPTGLAASNVTQSGLDLSWNSSSDNVGVTGYDVYRNGTRSRPWPRRRPARRGLTCGTSYAFGDRGAATPPGTISAGAARRVPICLPRASPPPPPPADTTPPSTPTGLAASNVTQTAST